MAAATLVGIMEGIQARLQTIVGLQVSATSPGQITPPAAVVGVPPIPDYRLTMRRGFFRIEPTITILVSSAATDAGQRALAAYADVSGTNSIPAAIEADRTLGGVVSECLVDSFRSLGLEEVGIIGYYGGIFTLSVTAPGA